MLTRRMQDAMRFIQRYTDENKKTPTVREVAQGIGLRLTSVGRAHELLRALEERGFIKRSNSHGRRLEILKRVDQRECFVWDNDRGQLVPLPST